MTELNKTYRNTIRSLNEQIVSENSAKKLVVIYPGRFQPMGKHHAATYIWARRKFKGADVHMVATGKVEPPASPFTFEEKEMIAGKYGIVLEKVKNPYIAEEVLGQYDPDTTSVVFLLGKKDADRLSSGKYFRKWEGITEVTYRDGAYVATAPHVSLKVQGYGEMSGTVIREAFGADTGLEDKMKLFKQVFGFMDEDLFALMMERLYVTQDMMDNFLVDNDLKHIISESETSKTGVDDGPRFFYGNQATYKAKTAEMAERLGFKVIDYVLGDEEFEVHDTDYPHGPPGAVSFFPVGVMGKHDAGTNYIRDRVGKSAYDMWIKYITKVAQRVGYKLIDYLEAEDSIESSRFEDLVVESKPMRPGAHMSHPFEDHNLTFADMEKIVRDGLRGKLEAVEKTDGQNLKVTWKGGELLAARNKGQLREPIGIDGVKEMFEDRGPVRDGFVHAMEDLQSAFSSLKPEWLEKVFADGKNFMNLEVLYEGNRNVMDYDGSYIQFHGVTAYEDGEPVGEMPRAAEVLAEALKTKRANLQSRFKVIPPTVLEQKKHPDFDNVVKDFIERLKELRGEFHLKRTDTLGTYFRLKWTELVEAAVTEIGYNAPQKLRYKLVERWADGNKSHNLHQLKKDVDNDRFRNWMLDFDKNRHMFQKRQFAKPFEELFLEFGGEVLSNVSGFLASEPERIVTEIKDRVASEIKEVKSTGNRDLIQKMEAQLKRIDACGGLEKLAPVEGLVFEYNGNKYKLTGAFAAVNNLLGILRYAR